MIVEYKPQKSNNGFNSPCCAKVLGDPKHPNSGWNWDKPNKVKSKKNVIDESKLTQKISQSKK